MLQNSHEFCYLRNRHTNPKRQRGSALSLPHWRFGLVSRSEKSGLDTKPKNSPDCRLATGLLCIADFRCPYSFSRNLS